MFEDHEKPELSPKITSLFESIGSSLIPKSSGSALITGTGGEIPSWGGPPKFLPNPYVAGYDPIYTPSTPLGSWNFMVGILEDLQKKLKDSLDADIRIDWEKKTTNSEVGEKTEVSILASYRGEKVVLAWVQAIGDIRDEHISALISNLCQGSLTLQLGAMFQLDVISE